MSNVMSSRYLRPVRPVPFVASRRVRRTHFTPGVEDAGVSAYTVYNRMLLPAQFKSMAEDCQHLKQHVQVWDVSVERQLSIQGPDADRLLEMLSPRDLSRLQDDQCFYTPIVDRQGGMLNDPVLMRIAPQHYWVSLADSDLLLYVLGLADALGLDVEITEPDVSPLAVQGPKADTLMARIFGQAVHDIRFFRYKWLRFEGHKMLVARSGYSKQGGFEIYVEGGDYAMPLWERLMREGEDLNVQAGCPNLIERIEGGLLSYGNDMTRENTPFEAGLGKFVNSKADFIGKEALARRPAQQMVTPLSISGEIPVCDQVWPVFADGKQVGQVTSAAFSPDFGVNVAISMLAMDVRAPGTRLQVHTQADTHDAQVQEAFWI